MRVQIFSDLHVDVAPNKAINVDPDVDAVIVAGDTCEGGVNAFELLRRIVPMQIPILMTMGNHEYYRRCVPEELSIARAQAPLYGVHLLENLRLEDLAAAGAYEFAFVMQPLKLKGATGAAVVPTAIR